MTKNIVGDKKTIIPVILAGGAGTRLWPLSSKSHPKELLKLHKNLTLLQSTVGQIKLISNRVTPFIIGNASNKTVIINQLKQIKMKAKLLIETESKDTATTVALAARYALTKYKDPLLLILPVDHFISDVSQFSKMIAKAVRVANARKLVLFGVKPTYPAIDYGYIKRGKKISGSAGFYVKQFLEKPNVGKAKTYFNSKDYYLNSGISLFLASVLLEALATHSPKILSAIQKNKHIIQTRGDPIYLNTHLMKKCPAISIDKAVLEKAKNTAVFPFLGGWHDLGNWNALYNIAKKDKHKNAITKQVICFDTKNSYLYSTAQLLVTLSVNDLLIVVTKEAVLVAKRGQEHDIKKMVHLLRKKGKIK